MRRDVFQAIADPHRRAIIHLLSQQKLTPNKVAENFAVSRPAISKHLKILTECGLVIMQAKGRERVCEANLKALGEVAEWIRPFERFWNEKLDALGHFLESQKK